MKKKKINKNDVIFITYKMNNDDKLKIFDCDFVNNNKNLCKIIYNEKEYDLQEHFNIKNINKNKDKLEIILKGVSNIINMRCMF